MKLVYFASLRERIGKAEEERDLPSNLRSVADLIGWLSAQDQYYAAAFAHGTARAAIDRVHAKPEAAIAGAREIAFFPPMTGG
ncbi:MoaD/ThiS family protein [uncultured Rhodoblastus sp.]|uniref:MoaD/ThiS family protein n=1 Tax=uncultured Rhodoblastus sp. TaxID=543037 RepID=UPI0025EE983C|nr:MoaD/ThiS family protein [uncultured Rhodoblastus sp.]